jgi:RHS repeat-associated protein
MTYGYDNLSRMLTAANYAGTVTFAYDNRNRVTQVLDVHGRKVNYTFDAASNPLKMQLDNVDQVSYTFDNANRLATLKNVPDNKTVAYGYDIADRLISEALPNTVTTTYGYDGLSRLKLLKDSVPGKPNKPAVDLYNRQYNYNLASQISSIAQPTGAPIGTKNFAYDNLDRLTGVTGASTENYGYDFVGNRTTSQLSASYTYQPNNRLTAIANASFVNDSNGNMVSRIDASGTTQYIWDYEDKLRQVIQPNGTSINYKYDALGRRSERYIGTVSTKFTYDGQDVILDANSDGTSIKYVNGLGIDNKISQKVGTTISYFLKDHLGSTTALTSSTGAITSSATYDSFGNATGNLATRYGYTGREKDATTGLMYYRNRWYDSNLGRFISEDPIGFSGGINQFGYVGGNAQNSVDPTGTQIRSAERWQPGEVERMRELQAHVQRMKTKSPCDDLGILTLGWEWFFETGPQYELDNHGTILFLNKFEYYVFYGIPVVFLLFGIVSAIYLKYRKQ